MRNKTIFATHKQTHDRSNDIKEPKADIKECNKHIYKHITNRDQQDKICIFMCKMSEFMSQCRPDLLIRHIQKASCNTYCLSSRCKSVRTVIICDIQLNAGIQRRVFLFCFRINFPEYRFQTVDILCTFQFFTSCLKTKVPFSDR